MDLRACDNHSEIGEPVMVVYTTRGFGTNQCPICAKIKELEEEVREAKENER